METLLSLLAIGELKDRNAFECRLLKASRGLEKMFLGKKKETSIEVIQAVLTMCRTCVSKDNIAYKAVVLISMTFICIM